MILLLTITVTGQNTYLHCGKVVDTKGGTILTEKTIVVSGNKIIAIENGFVNGNTSEDKIIDLKTKTVMPGLIDMHVHIYSTEELPFFSFPGFIGSFVVVPFASLFL